MLVDRYAVGPVLEFLKIADMGSKDGGVEEENK